MSRPRRTSPRPNCCSPPTRPGSAGSGWFGSPLAFALLLGIDRRLRHLPLQPGRVARRGPARPSRCGRSTSATRGSILFGLCVLYAFLRFLFLYFRLRENRQLRVQGIAELSRRTRLRWLAAAKSAEAREQIETYLRTFPMNTEKDRKTLRALGLDDAGAGTAGRGPEGTARPGPVRLDRAVVRPLPRRVPERARRRGRGADQVLGQPHLGGDGGGARTPWSTRARRCSTRSRCLTDLCQVYNLRAGPHRHRGAAGPGVLQRVSRGPGDRVGEAGGGPVRPALRTRR